MTVPMSTVRLIAAAAFLAVAATAQPGPVAAQSLSEIAMMSGPDRQAKLLAGARKEGEFSLYTTLIVDQAVIPLKNGWEKKYPDIKFSFFRGNQAPVVQRIVAEARAGKGNGDVVVGSTSDALDNAQMLQPFTSPEFAAFPKEYIGKNNLWFTYRLAFYGIGYNTKLVGADAPKTWEDLLNPKFKGRMIWSPSRDTSGPFIIEHLRQIWGEKKAAEYFAGLAKQDIAKSDAAIRALLDLVIAGEHWILITTSLNHAVISAGQGAPVWFSSPDPVPTRVDHVMLLNNAPHPHAAMLFIDYILSREGQDVLSKAEYQVGRTDVDPLPSMVPIMPHLNGRTAKLYAPQDFIGKDEELMAIFDKISP